MIVKNIALKADDFSLEDISMELKNSQCQVIIGPTGSGKTLLLEAIMGFRSVNSGSILMNGKDVTVLPVEKRNVAYVPQDLAIFPHLEVRENVNYGLKINKLTDTESINFVMELCESVGITHLLDRKTDHLSGGELQRIALVRALVTGSKILVMDEPFSALHESLKKELWFLLKSLQLKYNLSILMVTHNLEEAYFLADVINIIIAGRIRRTGTKNDIYRFPRSLEVAQFMGLRNLMEVFILAKTEHLITANCPELNLNLDIKVDTDNHEVQVGTSVIAGIRALEIMIVHARFVKENQDNKLHGEVTSIIYKGASHTVVFLPDNCDKRLEIEVPNHAFVKLDLDKRKNIFVSLKSESIFLLSEP